MPRPSDTTRLLLLAAVLLPMGGTLGAAAARADRELDRALVAAARKGTAEEVGGLLARGANVNAADRYGQTALMVSAQAGRLDIVRLLLDRGAAVNAVNRRWEQTALAAAVDQYAPSAEVVRLLLARGADPNLPPGGETPLMRAANRGAAEAVDLLLAAGADIERRNARGETALLRAVDTATPAAHVVAALLARGADANDCDRAGRTPLMFAFDDRSGDTDEMGRRRTIIDTLLARGADVHARDTSGKTVLMWAAEHGVRQNVQLLLDRGVDVKAQDRRGAGPLDYLGNAILRDYTEVALLLLEKGAAVTGRDEHGRTPLMTAAYAGSLEAVQAMLARGADVSARDRRGSTALLLARGEKYREIADALMAHGADPLQARDQEGTTALMTAVNQGDASAVRSLLERGARVDARDNQGRTAMFYADCWEEEQTRAVLKELLAHGADIEARDRQGRTPLLAAASARMDHHGLFLFRITGTLRALLDNGASVKARDRMGATALILAASADQPGSNLEALLKAGAPANARDRAGLSALAWAARHRREEDTKLLRDHGAKVELPEALLLGDEAAATALVPRERSPNRRAPYGQTVLMLAAEQGYDGIVKALMARGADVSAKDENGMTALHHAVGAWPSGLIGAYYADPPASPPESARLAVVNTLLDHGAAVDALDSAFNNVGQRTQHETALEWAARWGWADIVRALLAHGADAKGSAGRTALWYADFKGHKAVCEILKKAGAGD